MDSLPMPFSKLSKEFTSSADATFPDYPKRAEGSKFSQRAELSKCSVFADCSNRAKFPESSADAAARTGRYQSAKVSDFSAESKLSTSQYFAEFADFSEFAVPAEDFASSAVLEFSERFLFAMRSAFSARRATRS